MRKVVFALLGLIAMIWLAIAVSSTKAHADYFQFPCQYPFVGTQADAKLGIIDAGGQFCDGPVEVNWTHYHCWSGGATFNIGAFAFAPVGPLSVGGVGGSGLGGSGGQCAYVCPDGLIRGFPNPPAKWVKRLVLDPKDDDCVGHAGIIGPTSTPQKNQLPGNMNPGEDPPDGVAVPAAPGDFPPGETNPPALPGPPPEHPPGDKPAGPGVPLPSGKPVTPATNDESPLTPGSPMALP